MRPLPQSEVSKRDGQNRRNFAPPRQVVEPLNANTGVPAVFDQEIIRRRNKRHRCGSGIH